jgi:choline dehydrogenase-like flavoprotein/predicted dehydrogenase
MPISSFSEFAASDLRDADLLIVGSGPAGMSIAHAFRETDLRVLLLESGGLEPKADTEALNAMVNVGHHRVDPEFTRRRCVGGTSTIWSGRCGMFDAIDLQTRPWVARSGWPVDGGELERWAFEAGRLLGLAPSRWARHALRDLGQGFDDPKWDEARLQPVVWQFSRRDDEAEIHAFTAETDDAADELAILRHTGRMTPVDFGRAHCGWIASSRSVHLVTHATALEVETEADGARAVGVRVIGPDGERLSLTARATVLACGGIDNARLLLCSRPASAPHGIGNHHDQVGRYLADHSFTELGIYGPDRGKAVRRRLGTRIVQRGDLVQTINFGVRLAPELQRAEGLLNAAAHLAEFGTRLNPLASVASGVRALREGGDRRRAVRDLIDGLSRPAGLAESAIDRLALKRAALNEPDRAIIGCVVEQPLQPESRIRLSDRRDRFGTPLPEIDWRVSDEEHRTAECFRQVLLAEIDRLGLERPGTPEWVEGGLEAWRAQVGDVAHPMCSTRMSDDPTTGVVDPTCKVHGIDGLYVAGSSVFSTPSHMNPTQMLVALALRLADHLYGELRTTPQPATSPSIEAVRRRRRSRLGIVGAGDRVQRIYRPVLEALLDEIEVVGITSRGGESARRLAAAAGWTAAPSADELVRQRSPDFVMAAVPPGDLETLYPRLVELGAPLLLETPFCWSVRAGRKLAKVISDRGLVVGVAEQFPFLPIAQLQRKVMEIGAIGRPRVVENRFSIFDYHGIARLRAVIDQPELPSTAHALRTTFASGVLPQSGTSETWDRAVFRYETGETIEHRFSNEYFDSEVRAPRSFSVFGSEGTFDGQTLHYFGADGRARSSSVRRDETGGRLQGLSVETALGTVAWHNPFARAALDEEQIAVATILSGMARAVIDGGSPLYDAVDALWDMELLAAMRASAGRGGAPVRLPVEPVTEKLRSVAKNRLRRG